MKIIYQNNYEFYVQKEKKLIIFNDFFYNKRVNLDQRERTKKTFFKLYAYFLIYQFK